MPAPPCEGGARKLRAGALSMRPLWQPTAEAVAQSNMTRFARQAAAATGQAFPTYEALHHWSITDPGTFWSEIWRFADIQASRPAEVSVRNLDLFPGACWFPGAQLNFAENLLRFRDEQAALVSISESGGRREISYAELHRQSVALAGRLQALGIGPGDRVAGWLPNTIETVIAMLATATLGGVWSSCSPDFGTQGALDRFGQIEPKVLFACDGYRYAGKAIDIRAKVRRVTEETPSIEQLIWVPFLGAKTDGLIFNELLNGPSARFAQVDFNHPLYILYSSGTTGKPKCIVHGVGGTLLQHAKEHRLHTGLCRSDRLFFFTTCGWMMWNWLVSALATGCTVVLYEGSPFHPGPRTLWDMAQREGVTAFGTSPAYLRGLAKSGFAPKESHRLDRLRMLLSTGAPLSDESFHYVYRAIKEDVHLVSMTGGTDLISCFILGNPNLPVYAGELQCKGLGMAVAVWREDGAPVAVGAKGELVCTRPFPSCPIGFWRDPDSAKFRNAYFDKFPGVWAQGDFAELTERSGYIIHGRSDAVLNPGGVRIGTAEIYRQVERIEEILDAICVGQEQDGDMRVILFVTLRPGTVLDADLARRIKQSIRNGASPRHVPKKIIAVTDIPRTLSGKTAELAVRDLIHGRPVANISALANPEALREYQEFAGADD